jgi:hypothetical protein
MWSFSQKDINKSVTRRGTFMKHIHHIIPKHMGGTNDPSNLIELTVEEHAEAHRLLYEQHGKYEDLLAYRCLAGQAVDVDFAEERAKLGGYKQGRINKETGHIQRIRKMANLSDAGKKGGAKTIAVGKGAFGNIEERLKSQSKGGKTQGKRNADSGHLKRIAQLPNTRSKGKMWITNGAQNKMINPTDIMPDGFRKGKVQK